MSDTALTQHTSSPTVLSPSLALWLIAGLWLASTASHLLQILAHAAPVEIADLEARVIAAVYAAAAVTGIGLAGAVEAAARRFGGALRHRVVLSLCALNLLLYGIAYGIGGEGFGLFLTQAAREPWIAATLGLSSVCAWMLLRRPGRGISGARVACVAGSLLAISSLATDASNAGSLAWDQVQRGSIQGQGSLRDLRADAGPPASVVHVLFDAMTPALLEQDPILAERSFFRRAPGGIYFRNAFTNSVATQAAIPQLLSGEFGPAWESFLFEDFRSAGAPLHLYLGTGPLECATSVASTCHSTDAIWAEEIFRGDWRAYARYQLTKLARMYLTRFAGSAIHALRDWRTFRKRGDLMRSGRSVSLVLLDRFLADFQSHSRPGYYFLHLVIPHAPFIHDATCKVVGDLTGLASEKARFDSPEYLAQVGCANTLAMRLVDTLQEMGRYDSTLLIMQSDHGPRGDLVELLAGREAAAGPFSEEESQIVEHAARMLLWVKPPGHRERRDATELVQMVELRQRIWQWSGLGSPELEKRQQSQATVEVIGLDLLGEPLAPARLVRHSDGRWELHSTAP